MNKKKYSLNLKGVDERGHYGMAIEKIETQLEDMTKLYIKGKLDVKMQKVYIDMCEMMPLLKTSRSNEEFEHYFKKLTDLKMEFIKWHKKRKQRG